LEKIKHLDDHLFKLQTDASELKTAVMDAKELMTKMDKIACAQRYVELHTTAKTHLRTLSQSPINQTQNNGDQPSLSNNTQTNSTPFSTACASYEDTTAISQLVLCDNDFFTL